ncbi:unnamed protein product [Bodo saltans]|uniref:Uncharacterized protein n=1 Tax=Bodo saltans TaxID=75058 RepID=A0A0S4JKR7_BODSA|nr:unnamed protein product [Bodo saltans]|eukprot:CUG92094.1 unnamed protein product [Bodo saltans]
MLHSVLDDALAAQAPYDQLNTALQQQFTLPEYRSRTIVHSISKADCYTGLPPFVRTILTEKRYAELSISVGLERLQLYPYHQIHVIMEHTKETPLSYYTTMLAMMLRAEKSYDALPNFTAVDILALVGVGRNQYLNLTKEARSKLWWRVSRSTSMIKELLPKEFIASACVEPFDEIWLSDTSSSGQEQLKKTCGKDEALGQLYKRILHRWKTQGKSFIPTTTAASSSGKTPPTSKSLPAPLLVAVATASSARSIATAASSNPEDAPGTPMSRMNTDAPHQTSSSAGVSPTSFERIRPQGTRSSTTSVLLEDSSPSSPGPGVSEPLQDPPPTIYATAASTNPIMDGEQFQQQVLHLQPRPFFYACELPRDGLQTLYRKGLVYRVISIDAQERIRVPPLENFVMNRTSDDPQESLFYRVLSTIDEQTSLDLLAQLLSTELDHVVLAAETFVRLGLAKRIAPYYIPRDLAAYTAVYRGWLRRASGLSSTVASITPGTDGTGWTTSAATTSAPPMTSESIQGSPAAVPITRASWGLFPNTTALPSDSFTSAALTSNGSFGQRKYQVEKDMDSWGDEVVGELFEFYQQQLYSGGASPSNNAEGSNGLVVAPPDRRDKKMVLMYDASLTGLLMMTNLSSDPAFKQDAVTLFEAGKLTDGALLGFVEKLSALETSLGQQQDDVSSIFSMGGDSGADAGGSEAFGGEATKYADSVICLAKVLALLLQPRSDEVEELLGSGVDMRKIESLNELEAKTRYLVLGRKYLSYFSLSPVSCAPLLDLELDNIYGATVALNPSPWMLLALYRAMQEGPGAVLLPFGTRLAQLKPQLMQPKKGHTTTLRVQQLAAEAEVTHCNPHTCLMLMNTMLASSPLFVQRIADVPKVRKADGFFVEHDAYFIAEVSIPFTSLDDEVMEIALEQIQRRARRHRDQKLNNAASTTTAGSNSPLRGAAAGGATSPARPTPSPLAAAAPPPEQLVLAPCNVKSSIVRLFRKAVNAIGVQHTIGYLTLSLTINDTVLMEAFLANRSAGGGAAGMSLHGDYSALFSPFRGANNSSAGNSEAKSPGAAAKKLEDDLQAPPQRSSSPPLPTAPSKEGTHQQFGIAPSGVLFIENAVIVDVGFGFPLQKRHCCTAMMQQVPLRCFGSAAQIANHNTAVKALSSMVLSLVEDVNGACPRPPQSASKEDEDAATDGREDVPPHQNPRSTHDAATTSLRERIRNLALGGSEESGGAPHLGRRGPSNQRHLRVLGSNLNGGSPFPLVLTSFDGRYVSVADDWDPLT